MKILQNTTIVVFVIMVVVYCSVMIYHGAVVDSTPPEISSISDEITISVMDDPAVLLYGITATDNRDGDLTHQIMIRNVSQLITADSAQVTYIVFDSSNNMATLTRTVHYSDYEKPKFMLNGPLNYTMDQEVALLDRLTAKDVLDGDVSKNICVISQNVEQEPGEYSVTVQVTNSLGDAATIPLKLVIGKAGSKQLIQLSSYLVYLEQGAFFDAKAYITGVQAPDGTVLANSNATIDGSVDTNTAGVYHVRYSCAAQEQTYSVYLTVVVE